MTITREQVADLQPGDVVEYSGHRDLRGAKLIGRLNERSGGLYVADYVVRDASGNPPTGGSWGDPVLTVVSRAPRPLYVNHPRTEPAPGDVATNAIPNDGTTWRYAPLSKRVARGWQVTGEPEGVWMGRETLPARLRLLVDGETGQVVP